MDDNSKQFYAAIHKGEGGCGKAMFLSNFKPTPTTPILASLGLFWLNGEQHKNTDPLICESCGKPPYWIHADWYEPFDRAKHT